MLELPNFDKYLEKMHKREQGLLAPSTLKEEKKYNLYLKASIDNFIG